MSAVASSNKLPYVWHSHLHVTRRLVRESLPVQKALELGWKPAESNRRARQYFRFEGPAKFEITVIRDRVAFTVGNQTSTYVPAVLTWLEDAFVERGIVEGAR